MQYFSRHCTTMGIRCDSQSRPISLAFSNYTIFGVFPKYLITCSLLLL